MLYSEMNDGMLKIALETWERMAMIEIERINEHDDISKVDKESLNAFGWYMSNYSAIMNEFSTRNEKLKFSVEEIFLAVGQKDRSGIFSFYPGSIAYQQYGEDVQGVVIYKKRERDTLEQIVGTMPLPRTDGVILLKSHKYNDTSANIESLKTQGFTAKDVMELRTFAFEDAKHSYADNSTKEIPNTINIELNLDGIDPIGFFIRLTEDIIEMKRPLLKHSLIKYYSYLYLVSPDLITEEIASAYLIDSNTGELSSEVNYIILDGKSDRGDILSDEEQKKLTELKAERFKERLKIVQKALSIPTKLLTKIYQHNRSLLYSILSVISGFETETLSGPESDYPVYWDFDRFSHIMFRHYKGLRIDESPSFSNPDKQPTTFQYVFKDVRRLVKIIINNLSKDIDSKLSEGKQFTISGYYYNGNYYNLRIDPDGRLMQFHPL
jgi:hypothetical protein